MSASSALNSNYLCNLAPIVLDIDLDQIEDGEEKLYTVIGESTDTTEVAASDDDVAGYLRGWGLANYTETFRANDVTLQSLPFLKDDMVKELIPSIGHRAQFLSHWDKWKASMHSAPTSLPSLSREREPSTSMEKTDASENPEKSELIHHSSQDTRSILLRLLNEIYLYGADKRIIFKCSKFSTIGFDEHYFAYEVFSPEQKEFFYRSLEVTLSTAPVVHHLINAPNGKDYITCRDYI